VDMVRLFVKNSMNNDMQLLSYGHVLTSVGYRLPLSFQNKLSDKAKRMTLKRIRHDWNMNEKLRKLQKLEIEEATGCRSIRSSGTYAYYDIITGDELDAFEYESRYMKYIQCRKKAMRESSQTKIYSPTTKFQNINHNFNESYAFEILVAAAASISNNIMTSETISLGKRKKRNISEATMNAEEEDSMSCSDDLASDILLGLKCQRSNDMIRGETARVSVTCL